MRKLLLGSTAIVAIAGLTTTAIADVSIKAYTEYAISSQKSGIAASKGTYHTSDSEIGFNFSNKTDNGLTIEYIVNMQSDSAEGGAGAIIDESYLAISGGFGKIQLGGQDSVAATFARAGTDLIAEESLAGASASNTITTHTDLNIGINDNNKVSYFIPTMGGFNAGISFEDSGAAATANAQTDITTYGASYTMELGGATVTVAAAQAVAETAVGTVDTEANNTSIQITRGNINLLASNGTYTEGAIESHDSSSIGASYKIDDTMTVGVFSNNVEDSADGTEAYEASGIELQYVIAAGLTAVINYEDFSYVDGTGGASNTGGADSGSNTKFTLKAAF